jgi:beta-N-acetylhexosaminidase
MGQGAYIFAPLGPDLTPDERAFFSETQPWGFILFARNIEAPDQVRRLTSELRASAGRDAPILIDQEGGRVQRMRAPHWREWGPPLEQAGLAGTETERSFWLRFRIIAQELLDVGIDVNCVPTCDLAQTDTHAVLRNRCYGASPETVTSIARAVVDGMAAGGVLPVMKHMPGHGRATVDSHLDLPRVTASEDVLDGSDFAVFRNLADLPMGMSAHLVFEALSDRAATIDPHMVALIRDRIGFAGLLMTDDISMEALDGDVASRSSAALAAGCDMVLHCNGKLDEMMSVARTAGTMSASAQARADAALACRTPPQPIDIAAAEAEFKAIMAKRAAG